MTQRPVPLQVVGLAVRDWWDDWISFLVVNLAWIFSWLTVVLGPPATFGLYFVANRLAHGPSLGLGGLWEGAKRHFWQSWLWMLLNLVLLGLLSVSIWFYSAAGTAWGGSLSLLVLFLAVGWLVVQFYALPFMIEQQRKNVALALRNGLFTALSAPGYTLLVAGLGILVGVLSIVFVLPLLLGGPSLIACLGTRAVLERIDTYRVRERDTVGMDGSQ